MATRHGGQLVALIAVGRSEESSRGSFWLVRIVSWFNLTSYPNELESWLDSARLLA